MGELSVPGNDLNEINNVLRSYEVGLKALPFAHVPERIRKLLAQKTYSSAEREELRDHFLLGRTEILEHIDSAGRKPQFDNGGMLETSYPPSVASRGMAQKYPSLVHIPLSPSRSTVESFIYGVIHWLQP